MATTGFHININGPPGETFPSFQSLEFMNGDAFKITLKSIRKRCAISNKLFFTVDGKSPVADNLTLAYYMSMTDEGTKILAARNEKSQTGTRPKERTGEKENGIVNGHWDGKLDEKHGEETEDKGDPEISGPAITTFTVNVAGKDSSPAPIIPLPAKNEALAKLMEGIGQGKIEFGKLPGFEDRDLVSLKADYATQPSETPYVHPSNMKEGDWSKVLANNRALYGYLFDYTTASGLQKARKRAFKIRGRASDYQEPFDLKSTEKDPDANEEVETGESSNKALLPPIPPFYVYDDAYVHVHESRSQYQSSLTKQGFNSRAIEFSLGGQYKAVAGSVEASYQQEREKASQQTNTSDVQSLIVAYNFPRVVVELDHDSLDLTDECKRDAMNVTNEDDVKRFYRNYGNVFVTSFALGGCLHSTRNVASSEKASLEQIKNLTRTAAGVSIQSPFASGSINYAKVESDSTSTGSANFQQSVQLAWDARGGNTLLCSNPPAWASTVNNFNLWRLMDQQQIVSLEGLIRHIDNAAAHQLENPSARSRHDEKPTDPEVDQRVRITLLQAQSEPDKSMVWQKIKYYYQDKRLDTKAGSDMYNNMMSTRYPEEPEVLLQPGFLFGGLMSDQQIGVGLYMFNKGELQL